MVEGHRLDQLGRVHLGEEQPQRPTGNSSVQVPHGVEQRPRRHVDDPLLGSQPAKLRVADGRRPQVAGTGDHGVDRTADHDVGDGVDRRPLDLVAAPDRERKRVAGQPIDVGAQHEVRGRVVRVRVHRVRSVEHRRGREPNVERVSSDDGRHVAPLSPFAERHASIAQTPDVCCKDSSEVRAMRNRDGLTTCELAARHPMWSRRLPSLCERSFESRAIRPRPGAHRPVGQPPRAAVIDASLAGSASTSMCSMRRLRTVSVSTATACSSRSARMLGLGPVGSETSVTPALGPT